jgi:hypothetical protein
MKISGWNGRGHTGSGAWRECGVEESGRFLKKAAQKLLLCWAMGVVGDKARGPA